MRTRATGRLAVLTALLALLGTGCSPDPVAPPTPSPVAPSPTPTENAQEREQRLAYEAAEKSYRDFRTEFRRVTRAGGAKEPTPAMRAAAAGPYLAAAGKTLKAYQDVGAHTTGNTVYGYIRPAGYETTSLLLDVCEDERTVSSFNAAGKKRGSNGILKLQLTVRRVDQKWKVWSEKGSEVSSCGN